MALSSGTNTLLKTVGSWCLAVGMMTATVVYYDELRTFTGLKLDAKDFGFATSSELNQTSGPARSSAVELTAGRSGHFETNAYLNGRPVNVLVDTGATLVSMSFEDARAAGIHVRDSDFRYVTQTANGTARAARVTLDEVSIGDIKVRNVAASVAEPGRLHVTLLGMSFLGRLKFQMQSGRLTLEQ